MSPEEITRCRHALKAGKLSERWIALALLTRRGVLTEAERCEALLAAKDAPPRSDETPRDLDSFVSALQLALSRDRPRGGVRILLDIIQHAGMPLAHATDSLFYLTDSNVAD
jgi:hypothetical protein